jgi:hypothetical protein
VLLWGVVVPLLKLITETPELSLSPEDTAALVAAFDSTLVALGLAHREDQVNKLVAERIIEIARNGERDPHKIKQAVLASLKG